MEHSEQLSKKPLIRALMARGMKFRNMSFLLAVVINLLIIATIYAPPSNAVQDLKDLKPPIVDRYTSTALRFFGMAQIVVSCINFIIIYQFYGLLAIKKAWKKREKVKICIPIYQ
jgi:hypothetical protein